MSNVFYHKTTSPLSHFAAVSPALIEFQRVVYYKLIYFSKYIVFFVASVYHVITLQHMTNKISLFVLDLSASLIP